MGPIMLTVIVLGVTLIGGLMFNRQCPNDDWAEKKAERRLKRMGHRAKDADLEELQHEEKH